MTSNLKKEFQSYDVIIKPVITEKASFLSQNNQVVFKVGSRYNKADVKAAVSEVFNVEVEKVNIINTKPKTKRFRGFLGKRSGYKKAIVTLKEGQTIDVSATA